MEYDGAIPMTGIAPPPTRQAGRWGAMTRDRVLETARSPSRLAAVHACTALLDASAEETLESSTRLASWLLNAPAAFVAIVGEDRLHLRGCVGLPEPLATERELPLFHSFCPHVVAMRTPLAIEDARKDPMLSKLPATKASVVSYLGVPLITPGGHALGALCVLDSEPRRWTPDQVRLMTDLARSAQTKIELLAAVGEAERRAVDALAARSEAEATRQRYRDLVEGLNAIVWEADAETLACSFVSGRAEDMLGYPVDDWIDDPAIWGRVVHEEDLEWVTADRRDAMQRGGDHEIEYRMVTADGHELWVRDNMRVVVDADGRPRQLRGLIFDITERMRLEELLRQAQKLEAIGRLAGGVAHDFNNLITGVTGYCQLLMESFEPGDTRRSDIEEIRKAAERAAGLTHQLLAFSRKQGVEPKVIDLNAVVTDIEKLLRRVIGEDITLRTVLGDSPGFIRADPGQIDQVLMNLVVNARDAMPDGGTITIATRGVTVDRSRSAGDPVLPVGEYVALEVSDTGCGMDRETISRIFDPLFTTKEPGKGTGLGLATVAGIVRQSGGQIVTESEVGEGTTFRILLPRTDPDALHVEAGVPVTEMPAGSETILVVEDDRFVRDLVRRVLTRAGYTVLEAANGVEALLLSERFLGPIHLLLTDVVMPKMGGRDLIQRLLARMPGLKVVLMSGYDEEQVRKMGAADPRLTFIEKPFRPAALARTVREVLDRDDSGLGAAR